MTGGVSWTMPSELVAAHVRQMLRLADVDLHVFLAGVQADDLASVDLFGRAHKGSTASFGVLQAVRRGRPAQRRSARRYAAAATAVPAAGSR